MYKVCHITNAHPRYDGRILGKECASLRAYGYDVTLLVNDDIADEIYEDVSIISIRQRRNTRFQRFFSLKTIYKKAVQIDADIYHLHDPELLLIAKGLKRLNKKVIFDSHEFYYEQIKSKAYIPKGLRTLVASLYFKYETSICQAIDGVIFVRPVLKNGEEYNPFEDRCRRIEFIANYPQKIKFSTHQIKERIPFTACYSGGLSHERGITYLIDACYKASCRLILAGKFTSDEYKRELKKKESFSCVDYRGWCSKEELYRIYEESHVGMATLLNKGQYHQMNTFATKVFEYFQMRLPVIISDYPYAKKMNDKYSFGIIVDPCNVDDIVTAIEKIKREKYRVTMGNRGYSLYFNYFNWEKEAIKLINFYSEILMEK